MSGDNEEAGLAAAAGASVGGAAGLAAAGASVGGAAGLAAAGASATDPINEEMKQGGVVLAMGKKKMSRAVIQLSLGVDVVGNLLWLAVGVAMGLSVGGDVVCD
jgi:hypothetical protein